MGVKRLKAANVNQQTNKCSDEDVKQHVTNKIFACVNQHMTHETCKNVKKRVRNKTSKDVKQRVTDQSFEDQPASPFCLFMYSLTP